MKRIARALGFLPCLALCLVTELEGQDGERSRREWPTPGEQRGWFAPTTPLETGQYLTSLAELFPTLSLDTLAWIDGGSVQPDSALPVLLARVRASEEGARERVRVLVLAGQQGDDLSGTEVSLQLLRELVMGEIGPLLDELDVAIVPAANPWGLLWWMPEEPSGIDLATDHSRLRSASTRAVHDFVRRWRPSLVVELRELGPAVYRVQAGLPKHPNVDARLNGLGRYYLLPFVANELARASVTFREHVAVGPESSGLGTPLLGADDLPDGAYLTPGALGADRASNAFSLAGSLSVMLGVASVGGAEGLPDRVQLLYQSVGYLLEAAAAQSEILLAHRDTLPSALSLRQSYVPDDERPDLAWLVWNDRGQIVQQTTDRWRSVVRRDLALPMPAAWVIEPAGLEWAELASRHGFTVDRLSEGERLDVASYLVGVTAALPTDLAEGLPPDAAPDGSSLLVRSHRDFPQGSWLVRADQARARWLFTLLEPWSQDAPLGREQTVTERPEALEVYPVHRIEAGRLPRSVSTEPFHPADTAVGRAARND